jgi:fatty-acyl-CoA synthase
VRYPYGVAELLVARADDDRPAYRQDDRTRTWRQVVAESARRHALLGELRRPGPFHVGIYLENVPEYLLWLGGTALAGATAVGINLSRSPAEIETDIRHTDCQLLVTDGAGRERLAALDLPVGPDRVLAVDDPGYAAALARHDGAPLPAELPDPSTLALLLFTSGSTGAPKAVRCTAGRLAATGAMGVERYGMTPDDIYYCAMPLFHGNALMYAWMPTVHVGASIALRRRFSASNFLPDVRRYGATIFNYVGKSLSYVLATPERPDDGDNPLVQGYGTEASWKDVQVFERRFGCTIKEGYGMSEGGGIGIRRTPDTPEGALGTPITGSIVVVDPVSGQECPPARFDPAGRLLNGHEAIGEIVNTAGLDRFEGYYANPDATAARARNGWFWSGDLGYRDEAGYFYFAGRGFDALRVDGENFSAAPVERILYRFPDVVGAAVYAVPDPDGSDAVMVALELREGARFDAAAFAGFLGDQPDLGPKWVPTFVRLVAALPVTGTNKVDKGPLRRAGVACDDPVWWRPSRKAFAYRPLTDADRTRYLEALEARGRASALTGDLDSSGSPAATPAEVSPARGGADRGHDRPS